MGKYPVITANIYSIPPMFSIITKRPPVITANLYSITGMVYSKPSMFVVILPNVPVITAGVPVITVKSGGMTAGIKGYSFIL
jgi:hypothetical protein